MGRRLVRVVLREVERRGWAKTPAGPPEGRSEVGGTSWAKGPRRRVGRDGRLGLRRSWAKRPTELAMKGGKGGRLGLNAREERKKGFSF